MKKILLTLSLFVSLYGESDFLKMLKKESLVDYKALIGVVKYETCNNYNLDKIDEKYAEKVTTKNSELYETLREAAKITPIDNVIMKMVAEKCNNKKPEVEEINIRESPIVISDKAEQARLLTGITKKANDEVYPVIAEKENCLIFLKVKKENGQFLGKIDREKCGEIISKKSGIVVSKTGHIDDVDYSNIGEVINIYPIN